LRRQAVRAKELEIPLSPMVNRERLKTESVCSTPPQLNFTCFAMCVMLSVNLQQSNL